MNDFDFPDLNPLLIWSKSYQPDDPIWVNPFIFSYLKVDENEDEEHFHQDVYVIGNDSIRIAFLSDWITERFSAHFESNPIFTKSEMYSEKYVDLGLVTECIKLLLTEDVYTPYPEFNSDLKSLHIYTSKNSEGQFCFSPEGELVADLLEKYPDFNFFTPDCGFWYDSESDSWGYDT